ncbi:MAG: hypothetical protein EZS28_027921 [Streblomastix strix]|uniref:Uncharacterized protein n=1 Tax=Streblomastix strix TaxID=222440 RepID=A0A5J4V257_9EUKA|nr:MAG: hypothetical protein EZS28_027921 [Streblomastix strix]
MNCSISETNEKTPESMSKHREGGNEIITQSIQLKADKLSANSLNITSKYKELQKSQINNDELLPPTQQPEKSKSILDLNEFRSDEQLILSNDDDATALPAWAIVVIVAIIFSAIVAVVSVICCYKLITKFMDQRNENKSANSKHQAVEEGQNNENQIIEQQPTQQLISNRAVANPKIDGRQIINTTPTTQMFEFPQQEAV